MPQAPAFPPDPGRGGKMNSHSTGVPAAGGSQGTCHLDTQTLSGSHRAHAFSTQGEGLLLPQGPGAWGRAGHLNPGTDSRGDAEAPTSTIVVINTVERSYLLLMAELSLK